MRSGKRMARVVGALLVAHLLVGLIVPFVMLGVLIGPPGFLVSAAANGGQVRAAVLLLFAGSSMAIAITIAAWPVLARCSTGVAFWLLALAVAGLALQGVDNGALMTMLSVSQEYARAGSANPELFQGLAAVVGSARRWAHYSALLLAVTWILVFCAVLFRFALVPRALAAFALIGSILQISGVTIRGFLGYSPLTVLAMPLAPAYVALAVWLIVKGFDERRQPAHPDARGAALAEG